MSNQDFERGYTKPDTTEMRKTGREERQSNMTKDLYSGPYIEDDEDMEGGFLPRNNTQDRL